MSRFVDLAMLEALAGDADSLRVPVSRLDLAAQNAAIEQAIIWAESRVLSFTTARYGAILPTTPATSSDEIRGLVADLARLRLDEQHLDLVRPQIEKAGGRAMAHLRDVAQRRADLVLDPPVAADRRPYAVTVVADADRPRFDRRLLARHPLGGRRRC
ncbi:MAG: hypothetical protein AAGE94_20165 [Acidobacteriota bacterium]